MGTIGKILPYINGFVMALKEMVKTLAIFVGYKSESTGIEEPFKEAEDSVGGISSGLGSANKQAKELKKTLMGFEVLNVIQTPKDTSGGGAGAPSIDPKILGALKEYDSIMEGVRMKAIGIRDKIMEWLGFTKQINPFTGEISWKLKEGWTNLKKISIIIKGLVGMFLIAKLIKLVGWLSKLGGVLKGTAVATTSFQRGLVLLNGKLFTNTKAIGKHAKATKGALPPVLKLISGLGGLIVAIKGTSSMFKIYDKTIKNQTVTNKEMWGSVLGITGGITALGATIGGPMGAMIGAGVGLIASFVTNIVAMNKAIEKTAYNKLFGNLTISTEQWLDILSQSDKELKDYSFSLEKFKDEMGTLSESVNSTSNSLRVFLTKSSLGINKLTNEDVQYLKSSIESIGKDSISVVEKDTDRALYLFGESFKKSGDIIDEGEQEILNDIMEYGEKQKTTIKNAQDNITTTYQNAINSRGYLTDEERKYIENQLAEIERITKESMSVGETDMEYYLNSSKKYSKETYDNFKKASEQYLENVKTTASERFNEQVNWANKLYGQNEQDQDKLNQAIKKATEERENTESEANDKVAKGMQGLLSDMSIKYAELEGKTDKTSKAMRKEIEDVFKNYNIDASDIVTYSEYDLQTKGNDMGKILGQGAKASFKSWFNIGKLHFGQDEGGGVKFKWYATGGMPDVGEMFVAREAGPELVGRIGNRTTVMNNDQIVSAVSNGVASAVSQVMAGQQGGVYQFYFDGEEITDVVQRRTSRRTNIMGA